MTKNNSVILTCFLNQSQTNVVSINTENIRIKQNSGNIQRNVCQKSSLSYTLEVILFINFYFNFHQMIFCCKCNVNIILKNRYFFSRVSKRIRRVILCLFRLEFEIKEQKTTKVFFVTFCKYFLEKNLCLRKDMLCLMFCCLQALVHFVEPM